MEAIKSIGPITLKEKGNNLLLGKIDPCARRVVNAMRGHVFLRKYDVMGVESWATK